MLHRCHQGHSPCSPHGLPQEPRWESHTHAGGLCVNTRLASREPRGSRAASVRQCAPETPSWGAAAGASHWQVLDLGVATRRGDRAGLGVSCHPTSASPGARGEWLHIEDQAEAQRAWGGRSCRLQGSGAGHPIPSGGEVARLLARSPPPDRVPPQSLSYSLFRERVTARGAGHTPCPVPGSWAVPRRAEQQSLSQEGQRGGLRSVTSVPLGCERCGGSDQCGHRRR